MMKKPDVLNAKRYRAGTVYIILCFDKKLREVFASWRDENDVTKLIQRSNQESICRLVSLALQNNVKIEDIIKQLKRSSIETKDFPGILVSILEQFMAERRTENG